MWRAVRRPSLVHDLLRAHEGLNSVKLVTTYLSGLIEWAPSVKQLSGAGPQAGLWKCGGGSVAAPIFPRNGVLNCRRLSAEPVQESLLDKGFSLYNENRLEESLEALSMGLEQHQDVVECLLKASVCCLAIGDDVSAMDFAFTALTVDPKNDQAWYRGIYALRSAGKVSEARALLDIAPQRAKRRASEMLSWEAVQPCEDPFTSFHVRISKALGPPPKEPVHQLKREAFKHYKSQNFADALDVYEKLIAATSDEVARTLCLRASVHVRLNNKHQASVDLCAASVIDAGVNTDFRAGLFRGRSEVLLDLNRPNAAQRMADIMQSLGGGQIDDQQEGGPGSNDKEEDDYEAEKSAWTEETVNIVRGLDPDIGTKVTNRVPKIHEEYGSAVPESGTDDVRTLRRLTRIYHECRVLDNRVEIAKRFGKDPYPKTFFCKLRLGDAADWLEVAKLGEIKADYQKHPYDTNCSMGYSNVYPQVMDLEYGRTHVGIGYVDLGVLLMANFVGNRRAGPVNFVGFDLSPYAQAKASVMLQMMRRGDPTDAILQVGYSSGWSFSTLEAFDQAVYDVIRIGYQPESVFRLLEHWKSAKEVHLGFAQEQWLSWHGMIDPLVVNIRDPNDRMELMRYFMTGRLLDSEVGSPIMYDNPEDLPMLVANETVFWSMSMKEMVQNYEECGSMMKVVVHVLRGRIERLKRRVLAKEVTWELNTDGVDLNGKEMHESIRAMKPRGVSWSNLCDFAREKDFHEMAKACSVRGTWHYLHSIHWLQDVMGSYLVDYPENQKVEVLESMQKEAGKLLRESGMDKHMLDPPIFNQSLISGLIPKEWFDRWCEGWLKTGGVKLSQVKEMTRHPFSVIGRWEGTLYLKYTYDSQGKDGS
ncbi:hypothetical protein BSKO_03156 [Bryopsis sp. KO-2023]|nr:hypothetical protein BSKO_03156 [Bryopsis sp. KO-2023]